MSRTRSPDLFLNPRHQQRGLLRNIPKHNYSNLHSTWSVARFAHMRAYMKGRANACDLRMNAPGEWSRYSRI
jgi:hypothetical protein